MITDTIRLWKAIDMDLCHDLDTAIGAGQYSGGLARSPLKKSSVAILGINWGGLATVWSHDPVMPPASVVEDMGDSFAIPLIRLIECVSNSRTSAETIINNSFSTNRILVQTRDARRRENVELLRLAHEGSAKALRRMLAAVQPRVVFCLGYNDSSRYMSPSSFVLRDLARLTEPLWQSPIAEGIWPLNTRRPSWVYYYRDLALELRTASSDPLVTIDRLTHVDVWCFAHPSARWAWSPNDGPWSSAQLVAALRSSLSRAGVLPPE